MSENKDTTVPEGTTIDDAAALPIWLSRRSWWETVKVWQGLPKLMSVQSTTADRQNRPPGAEVVPLGHGVGVMLPGEPQELPTGHGVQEAAPADAANVPEGHGLHLVLPAGEKEPEGHG